MKQHITEEQLNELSAKQLDRLEEWTNREIVTKKPVPKDFRWNVSTLDMSIGQMIEFLEEKHGYWNMESIFWEVKKEKGWIINFGEKTIDKKDLCDALWEAVKDVL